MISFFRKIRQQLLTESKFSKYLVYAIGEILLVVIGILIALQINNWNTDRVKKQDELRTYKNIKQQIVDDQKEIATVIDFNNYYLAQFKRGSQIITSKNIEKIDSLAGISMTLSQYSDFTRSGNIYETLVNSGDLKLLKNTDIPGKLQKLEMTYNNINRLEEIHWQVIMDEFSPEFKGVMNYATFEIVKPDKLYSVEIQNIFIECIYLCMGKDVVYKEALEEINHIIDLIDEELNPVEVE